MKILIDYDEVARYMSSSRSSLRTLRLLKKFPEPCFNKKRQMYWDLQDVIDIRFKERPINEWSYPDVYEKLIEDLEIILKKVKEWNKEVIDEHIAIKDAWNKKYSYSAIKEREEQENEQH
jgi:hypothetical protein